MDLATEGRRVVECLGGGTAVAMALSRMTGSRIDRERVYQWAKRDTIPWPWREPIHKMLRLQRRGRGTRA